jgi:hypothetical protein
MLPGRHCPLALPIDIVAPWQLLVACVAHCMLSHPAVQDLLEGLRQWDFAPEALADEAGEELLALAVPPIRTDLRMREAYCAAAATSGDPDQSQMARLRMPLHVFGGRVDRSCPESDLLRWKVYAPEVLGASTVGKTQGGSEPPECFSCTLLPGGHFYHNQEEARALLINQICSRIREALNARPPSLCNGPAIPYAVSDLPYMHEMVEAMAQKQPDAIALIGRNSKHTFAQLVHDATLVGGWVNVSGGGPSKHVALLMEHCPECV